MNFISFYLKNVKITGKSRLVYPASFALSLILQIFGYFVQFFSLWTLIRSFNTLQNWKPEEVVLIFSLQLISYSIASSVCGNTISDLPKLVKTGKFDEILTKPVDSLFYLISTNFNIGYIAHFLISLIMMIYALKELNIHINLYFVLYIVYSIIIGSIITGSLMLISTIPVIYLIGDDGFWGLLYDLRSFTNYPIVIYSKIIQIFFTIFIPYAFIAFYPLQHLLKKEGEVIFSKYSFFLSFFIAFICLILVKKSWNYSIKRYTSSGT